jgi:hypothetical protein
VDVSLIDRLREISARCPKTKRAKKCECASLLTCSEVKAVIALYDSAQEQYDRNARSLPINADLAKALLAMRFTR